MDGFMVESGELTKVEQQSEQRKKTRRGKKKKFSSFIEDVMSETENDVSQCSQCGTVPSKSKSMNPYDKCHSPRKQGRKKGHLRPSCSPKAPHNSTQFLIEDHLGNQTFDEQSLNLKLMLEDYCQQDKEHCVPSVTQSPVKVGSSCQDSVSDSEFSPRHPSVSTVSSPVSDIDYDYDVFGNLDSRISFYVHDFEVVYK